MKPSASILPFYNSRHLGLIAPNPQESNSDCDKLIGKPCNGKRTGFGMWVYLQGVQTPSSILYTEPIASQNDAYLFAAINLASAVTQWLRCCATNRKVAGSIPDGVIGIFHWHNPSDRTMALGVESASTTNEHQDYSLGVKAAGTKGWQLYHHPGPLSCSLGTLTSWNPLSTSGLQWDWFSLIWR